MSSPARDELDAELMRTLAEGDDLALNRLMDAWSQPLISYLMRLTGSHATACDLAQETFVRVQTSANCPSLVFTPLPTSKPPPTNASPPCKKPSASSRMTCARY